MSETTLKIDRKSTPDSLNGMPVLRDGAQVGWIRQVESRRPVYAGTTRVAMGFTVRKFYRVKVLGDPRWNDEGTTQGKALAALAARLDSAN